MNKLFNVSSSPHVRHRMSTASVMFDVLLALLPAAVVGVWVHGLHAFLVIAMAVCTAVIWEFLFDYLAHKENTTKDLSAVVTGLLLALCLPANVPLYIPFAGSIFAVVIVKGLFGGLGKNFMNPAVAARCFLLISFSTAMTNYTLDGVSAATPLADMAAGKTIALSSLMLGNTSGVIGSSALALFVGGMFLWTVGGITLEIPAATILSFAAFVGLFGGQGFAPLYLLANVCGGGILMAAFFMATDPVTSPVTSSGQIVFGVIVGVIAGIFRVFGSATDSTSYAIIIANMFVPLIDEYIVPLPFGHRAPKGEGPKIPKSAITLCGITLIAGLALSGVFALTKDTIEEQKMAANAASYKEVCPDAESFKNADELTAAIEALDGGVYGTDFGRAFIKDAVVGVDASGNPVGYVIQATSSDGFDGNITLSIGIQPDGTIHSISFTELNETAGMGMRCGDDEFKNQFNGRNVSRFTLNKTGGAASDTEINSVSGASISSGAVLNAINAALDFFAANVK